MLIDGQDDPQEELAEEEIIEELLEEARKVYEEKDIQAKNLMHAYSGTAAPKMLRVDRSLEDHLKHLYEVLKLLEENSLKVKMSKYLRCERKVEHLGHIISAKGVVADPSKVKSMTNWPILRNVRELRGFLGLTNYYRRFVAQYGKIAAPLTALLRKDSFVWSNKAMVAFEELKSTIISVPVLTLPDFQSEFVVECEASRVRIGVVLMQGDRPIAFLSKALSGRSQ
ncbi:uncharacterized mitochondrial protein AtMg00860-like [Typha angustifolia]|uniref:uncharacterized mitochondrial protein AtMg00860-like n=1 Tax=Typha angustifolia TaxID=59011 RepID=UPI003C3076E8